MTTQEKIQVVGISALVSLAFAVVAYYFVKPAAVPGVMKPYRAPADDAPIIMAGGSLYIGNYPTFWFTQDSGNANQLDYSANMQVFQVDDSYYVSDVLNHFTTPVAPNKAGSVEFDYCKDAQDCDKAQKQLDHIKLAWDKNGVITITNSLGSAHKFSMLTPFLRVHDHKQWVPKAVTFTGSASSLNALDCTQYDDGACTVVVHTCDLGQNSCTNITPNN